MGPELIIQGQTGTDTSCFIGDITHLSIQEVLPKIGGDDRLNGTPLLKDSQGSFHPWPKDKLVPHWTCMDHNDGSLLNKFVIKTQRDLLTSLYRVKDSNGKKHPYHKNIKDKIWYLRWSLYQVEQGTKD